MEPVACYVLGLENNFRGKELLNDLRKLGLPAEIFYGISASENRAFLSDKVDQQASTLLQERKMGLGEVACALGHMGIWKKFLESKANWAFVFEDDSHVNQELIKVLDVVSTFENPAIIQLNRSIADDKTVFLWEKVRVSSAEIGPHHIDLLRKLNFSSGAYAYLMNRAAAEIAVRESDNRKIINIVDWPYLWRHKVEFWEPSADLAWHQGESIIDEDRADLIRDLHAQKESSRSPFNRLKAFSLNVLGIPAWKFHRLGYPGQIVYFNNVVMPFKRRIAIYRGRLRQRFSSYETPS